MSLCARLRKCCQVEPLKNLFTNLSFDWAEVIGSHRAFLLRGYLLWHIPACPTKWRKSCASMLCLFFYKYTIINWMYSLFISLCKDETPMVRRAASANLGVRTVPPLIASFYVTANCNIEICQATRQRAPQSGFNRDVPSTCAWWTRFSETPCRGELCYHWYHALSRGKHTARASNHPCLCSRQILESAIYGCWSFLRRTFHMNWFGGSS